MVGKGTEGEGGEKRWEGGSGKADGSRTAERAKCDAQKEEGDQVELGD
jgi:hypothetical protein